MRAAPTILFVFLLFLSTRILAQCPENIGFEEGSLNGWQSYTGIVLTDGTIAVPNEGAVPGRQTLISKGIAKDPYGHFPIAPPNGSKFCVRLGNDINGHEAERLTYTYTIPAGQESTLILNWAVVLQDPNNGHTSEQKPRFTAKIFNVTDSIYINCPAFDYIAYSVPGFKQSDVRPENQGDNPDPVTYRDWSSTTINLVVLGGKKIRLEFTTNDCVFQRHFGYAYFDIDERCGGAIDGNTYCNGQQNVTLYAPVGFSNYTWFKATDLSNPIGHEYTLKVPSPVDGARYAVAIAPYSGVGCFDTLYATIHKLSDPFTFIVQDTVYGCRGIGADITDASITAGSSGGLNYSYYTDVGATTYMPTPKLADEGTYYIKGYNAGGCLDVLPVHVVLIDHPDLVITNPRPVAFPATVDLSKTFTHKTGISYTYYTDPAATDEIKDYAAIKHGGTYYIKAVLHPYECTIVRPVTVEINAPKIILTAPNAFTPNNDGINDMFSIKANVDGVLEVKDFKIYNRNGQLVFSAKSLTDYWNGTFNGKALPTGTYYWVLEGVNNMNNERVLKSAYITLVH